MSDSLTRRVPKKASESDLDNDKENDETTDDEKEKKVVKEPISLKKVMTRTIAAFIMVGLYLLMLQGGHFYCILVFVAIQIELYRELVNIRFVAAKEKKMPYFRSLQWAWFWVPMFYVYGETIHNFCSKHKKLADLANLTRNYNEIAYAMYE